MDLLIAPNGHCRCVYDELLDLRDLGRLTIQRASHVEPSSAGQWTADLSPVNGPQLGPFPNRSEALAVRSTGCIRTGCSPRRRSADNLSPSPSLNSTHPAHDRSLWSGRSHFPLGEIS